MPNKDLNQLKVYLEELNISLSRTNQTYSFYYEYNYYKINVVISTTHVNIAVTNGSTNNIHTTIELHGADFREFRGKFELLLSSLKKN